MQTALEEFAATEYVGVLNMTLTLLYDRSITENDAMPYYADDMMAKWFYKSALPDADVTVFVLPGNAFHFFDVLNCLSSIDLYFS